MRLEVIERRPAAGVPVRRVPLLCVHGAYGAAWTWDQHFLPYFADHGYHAAAVSLRGHGNSAGFERLPFARLKDYVADCEQVMDSLPRPPVLIGHSMGGMVVQKILHRRPVPAAVLVASVPPHGLIGSLFGMAFTNPTLFREMSALQLSGPLTLNGIAARKALFSDELPDERTEEYLQRFQPESHLVILDLIALDLPPSTPTLDLPVLVVGAENDAFVFPGAVRATAETYRTQAEIFPGMAHAMMLDHGWERVANRILTWLDETVPATASAVSGGRGRPAA